MCSQTFALAADLLVDLEPQWLLDKAVAQGNLALLLVDEGKLDAALATYEEVRVGVGVGATVRFAPTDRH